MPPGWDKQLTIALRQGTVDALDEMAFLARRKRNEQAAWLVEQAVQAWVLSDRPFETATSNSEAIGA